jgi:hypothetical protein
LDRFDHPDVRCGDPGAFERPADFRLTDAFPADPRLVGDLADGPVTAHVLVDSPRAAVLLAQGTGGAVVERRSNGSIVFEVPCVNVAAFRSWLLDLGAEAEVLSPPEVRDQIVSWLRRLAGAEST